METINLSAKMTTMVSETNIDNIFKNEAKSVHRMSYDITTCSIKAP